MCLIRETEVQSPPQGNFFSGEEMRWEVTLCYASSGRHSSQSSSLANAHQGVNSSLQNPSNGPPMRPVHSTGGFC